MGVIKSFTGGYRFLSNFYESPIEYHGRNYVSVEHAFQAAKATCERDHDYVTGAETAGIAKRRGREIKRREDWDEIKVSIMAELVWAKFSQNLDLAKKLIETYPHELIEGNQHKDKFWGMVNGVGKNYLGKILMFVRAKLMVFADDYGRQIYCCPNL
ncbi:MAG: NADAR family protein [Candidatus Dojkabacteria bacterium]